ncbi:MAG: hypothetical protein K1X78_09770 [Verrucomicrobiaceae bacterium]|nr:hypothetical protein [Verrucomicrobiaceae bacterium]
MTAQALILLASVLWLLMCLRFWTMIDRRNKWQRHVIAIAAGIGAGMIYLLGGMVWSLLKMPSSHDGPAGPAEVRQADDIRVAPRAPKKSGGQ